MFWSKKDNQILYQYYVDFNRVYEELRVLFFILQDAKRKKRYKNSETN